jgi:hypothetical protein
MYFSKYLPPCSTRREYTLLVNSAHAIGIEGITTTQRGDHQRFEQSAGNTPRCAQYLHHTTHSYYLSKPSTGAPQYPQGTARDWSPSKAPPKQTMQDEAEAQVGTLLQTLVASLNGEQQVFLASPRAPRAMTVPTALQTSRDHLLGLPAPKTVGHTTRLVPYVQFALIVQPQPLSVAHAGADA